MSTPPKCAPRVSLAPPISSSCGRLSSTMSIGAAHSAIHGPPASTFQTIRGAAGTSDKIQTTVQKTHKLGTGLRGGRDVLSRYRDVEGIDLVITNNKNESEGCAANTNFGEK